MDFLQQYTLIVICSILEKDIRYSWQTYRHILKKLLGSFSFMTMMKNKSMKDWSVFHWRNESGTFFCFSKRSNFWSEGVVERENKQGQYRINFSNGLLNMQQGIPSYSNAISNMTTTEHRMQKGWKDHDRSSNVKAVWKKQHRACWNTKRQSDEAQNPDDSIYFPVDRICSNGNDRAGLISVFQ